MEINDAVRALSSLAHETRLSLFRLLVQTGESGLAVGQINQVLQLPPATLSFHLKELNQAGLIVSRQEGRYVYYRADYAAMDGLLAFLTDNCCQGQSCLPGYGCHSGDKK